MIEEESKLNKDKKVKDLFSSGVNFLAKKEFDKAIEDYTKLIEFDPKHAFAYHNRGYAYERIEKYDKAIEDYTKSIELEPKHAFAYRSRGDAYERIEKYDKAIEDYTKSIELDPSDAFVYRSRGYAYKKIEKYDKAIEDYTKLIELDPSDAFVYVIRGHTYEKVGKHVKATADFNRAAKIDQIYKGLESVKEIKEIREHTNKLNELLHGFEDKYEKVKGKPYVQGYIVLKNGFLIGGIVYIFLLIFLYMYCDDFFDSFSPISILAIFPLAICTQSYLKYRNLEIKIRHRISLLALKKAEMSDNKKTVFVEEDMKSIIANVNSIVFSEIDSKGDNNFNLRASLSKEGE